MRWTVCLALSITLSAAGATPIRAAEAAPDRGEVDGAGHGAPSDADTANSLAEALSKGTPVFRLRYRYEDVRDEAVGRAHARASTLRTVIGYRTLPFHGLSLYGEAEDVSAIGSERFRNAGAGALDNGIRDRPVVADPDDTEINQALLTLVAGKTTLGLGRAEITLDDHRFVGNVGWRQNHQSFDGLTLSNHRFKRLRLFYAYIDRVRLVTGARDDMSSHLINARVDLQGAGALSLFGYLLDYDAPARRRLSTRTLGGRWVGERTLGAKRALLYELSYAQQRDAGDNPRHIDADYASVQLGMALRVVTISAGFERLEGNVRDGQFQTPLATLHRFNGWADKFLVTPVNGLKDRYLKLQTKLGAVAAQAVYHDFQSSTSSASYGSELDLMLTHKVKWGQVFGLKAAFYHADSFAADTDKVMFWTRFGR